MQIWAFLSFHRNISSKFLLQQNFNKTIREGQYSWKDVEIQTNDTQKIY